MESYKISKVEKYGVSVTFCGISELILAQMVGHFFENKFGFVVEAVF